MDIHLAAAQFYDYSLYIKGFSPQTIRRYRHAIKYYTSFAHVTTLNEISFASIRSMFFHGGMERQWRPATYRSYHKSLAVFFLWCKAQGYMAENPIAGLEVPKLERHLPVILSKQAALKVLATVENFPYRNEFIKHRNHAIIATLLYAGLRKTEVLQLRYIDIDLHTLTLFVHNGKGKKDRIIPICQALATILNTYLIQRKKLNITCTLFFASSQQNRGICESTIKRIVGIIRFSSNIPFSLHTLRRTFATLMIEGGCDIYSLSRMMGHEDIRTTTWYLHATTDYLRKEMVKHPLNSTHSF